MRRGDAKIGAEGDGDEGFDALPPQEPLASAHPLPLPFPTTPPPPPLSSALSSFAGSLSPEEVVLH